MGKCCADEGVGGAGVDVQREGDGGAIGGVEVDGVEPGVVDSVVDQGAVGGVAHVVFLRFGDL